MQKFDLIIVGGGIAGVSAVEQACLRFPNASVMLLTASPYVKIANTRAKLTVRVEELDIREEPLQDFLVKFNNLTIVSGILSYIHPNLHIIEDLEGKKFGYKKLCVCTGSCPKKFIFQNEHVITLRDTDSALILQEKLASSKAICIVGNGGIATELVHELQNVNIIWVIRDSHVSSTFLDSGAAEFLFNCKNEVKEPEKKKPAKLHRYTVSEKTSSVENVPGCALGPDWHSHIELTGKLTSKNVTVEYNTEVELISKDSKTAEEWPIYVKLKNGKEFGCDLVINATGVWPSVPSVKESPAFDLASDGGIKVNESMETSLADIYAAGDVCTSDWETPFHWFQMRLWSQARPMGAYAGLCALTSLFNNEKPLVDFSFELFTHVTRFFGFRVVLLGLFNGQKLNNGYEALVRVTKGHEYIKLVVQEGRIHGAVLIGDTGMEETFENLILNQLDISRFGEDLLNPDIDIDDYFD